LTTQDFLHKIHGTTAKCGLKYLWLSPITKLRKQTVNVKAENRVRNCNTSEYDICKNRN